MKFNLVCGPPGAGKNTFIKREFSPSDLIIDFDRLYDSITAAGTHVEKETYLISVISTMKRTVINELMNVKADVTVWVISSIPEGRKREVTARQLRSANTYLVMPKKEICIQHIKNDTKREYSLNYISKIVDDWYKNYSPSKKDIIVEAIQ